MEDTANIVIVRAEGGNVIFVNVINGEEYSSIMSPDDACMYSTEIMKKACEAGAQRVANASKH